MNTTDNNNNELEFADLVVQHNLNNLGQWKRWKAKNKDLAEQFEKIAKAYYTIDDEDDFFASTGSKKGRTFNFFSFAEFKQFLKDSGMQKFSHDAYKKLRESQPATIKARLPFNPKDVYAVAKS